MSYSSNNAAYVTNIAAYVINTAVYVTNTANQQAIKRRTCTIKEEKAADRWLLEVWLGGAATNL